VRLLKAQRDKFFEKLRSHITLAVADDFRQLVRHVTIEREQQTLERQEELKRTLATLDQIRLNVEQTLDGFSLVSESLVREIVLVQRQIAEAFPPTLPFEDHRHGALGPSDDASSVRRAA
jgi:hypothetical protein